MTAKNGCFQAQTEFDDIANTFDAEDARGGAHEPHRLRQRASPGAAPRSTTRSARSSRCSGACARSPASCSSATPSFENFFPALGRTAAIVAPVAEQQADIFTKGAITFAAISSDPQALQDTISETAPTLETGIDVLPRQRPFLTSLSTLARTFSPASPTCARRCRCSTTRSRSARRCWRARRRPTSASRPSCSSLNKLVSQPTTRLALQRLQETFDTAEPLAEYVAPAQTVCNYFNYWFTFLPNAPLRPRPGRLLVPPGARRSSRCRPRVDAPADGYSAAQSNGRRRRRPAASSSPTRSRSSTRTRTCTAGQQNADCEGGQSGYELGQGLLPGQSPSNPAYARHRPARLARPDDPLLQRRQRARARRTRGTRRAPPRPGRGSAK